MCLKISKLALYILSRCYGAQGVAKGPMQICMQFLKIATVTGVLFELLLFGTLPLLEEHPEQIRLNVIYSCGQNCNHSKNVAILFLCQKFSV